MGDDAYADYVEARYQGEVGGEALFAALAEARVDAEEARKVRVLERLERETKEVLAPEVEAVGRSLAPDEAKAAGNRALGTELGGAEWLELMGVMRTQLVDFVEQFRSAESLAPPGREALLQHVTAHEQALLDFAEAELAGQGETSLASTEALLRNA